MNESKKDGIYNLGRYRVISEIAAGSTASVHLAQMKGRDGFRTWVAIKRLLPQLVEEEQVIHRFLDEARLSARISHPNTVQVFDLGETADTYWLAMEYVHGEPLREVMRCSRGCQMGPDLAARVIADAAEGLHAAHELRGRNGEPLNLVHRDVTPHNIFVTYEGMVKVMGFGLAKVSGRLASTRPGILVGDVAYMSPERVRIATLDRRSDVFALGVVLWELTTGYRLFRMESDLDTLEKVKSGIAPLPSTVRPDYPRELEAIVMRAIQNSPENRYQTAREMSRALQGYLMATDSFVGPEEVGEFMGALFEERIRERNAYLARAAREAAAFEESETKDDS